MNGAIRLERNIFNNKIKMREREKLQKILYIGFVSLTSFMHLRREKLMIYSLVDDKINIYNEY